MQFSSSGPRRFPVGSLKAVLVACALGSLPLPVSADQSCSWRTTSNPIRQVITCGAGLTVEREAQTAITLFERSGDAPPSVIEIEDGAILIEVVPGSAPTQIRTPHAIAAVRGTTYVVDARADSTSVFVVEGLVEVTGTDGAPGVTLAAGEGVDVMPDVQLEAMPWPKDRATGLLARFGR